MVYTVWLFYYQCSAYWQVRGFQILQNCLSCAFLFFSRQDSSIKKSTSVFFSSSFFYLSFLSPEPPLILTLDHLLSVHDLSNSSFDPLSFLSLSLFVQSSQAPLHLFLFCPTNFCHSSPHPHFECFHPFSFFLPHCPSLTCFVTQETATEKKTAAQMVMKLMEIQ